MNRAIWKYPLAPEGATTILELPSFSDIVHFDYQHGIPCVWVVVDPTEEGRDTRTFSVIGTGWKQEGGFSYLGTSIQGAYVWHCVEVDL